MRLHSASVGLLPAKRKSKAPQKLETHRLMISYAEEVKVAADLTRPQSVGVQTDIHPPGRDTYTQTSVKIQKCKATQTQSNLFTKDKGTCPVTLLQPSVGVQCQLQQEESDVLDPVDDADHESVEKRSDPDFVPSKCTPRKSASADPQERKYIVFYSQLVKLFATCLICSKPSEVSVKEEGTCATVTQECSSCKKKNEWSSQPKIRQMPAGNLLMSAAILLSGCVVSKALRLFEYLNVAAISRSTYFRHQRKYLFSHIISTWKSKQRALLEEAKKIKDGLVLQGDARCDSPGHCAKFGSYSFIEGSMNKVLTFSLIQSNEVQSSYHMELEGLKRVVSSLGDTQIRKLITDRHRSIAKYIREQMVDVLHLFDVWHVAKGIAKKLDAAGRKSGCEVLLRWKRSIVNHLYWCAGSCPEGEGELIKAKWISILEHVTDNHTGFDNSLFPECVHDDVSDRDWMNPGTKAYVALEDIVASTSLLKDVQKLSGDTQTSSLESFHSLLLMFAPKHSAFSYLGMQVRLSLAAIHYNANSQREQAVTAEGAKRYQVVFPKAKKGEPSVQPIKTKPSFDYATEMITDLFACYENDVKKLMSGLADITVPQPLSESLHTERPNKADVVNNYVTRFPAKDA